MSDSQISSTLSCRIRAGERPSTVFRDLMKVHLKQKSDLSPSVLEAFPECDSTIIHLVWHWKEREQNSTLDELFDLLLIRELLQSGIPLPWTPAFCEEELEKLQPRLQQAEKARGAEIEASSYEALAAKLTQHNGKVACIQAEWDGDSNGWFTRLSAIITTGTGYTEIFLCTISLGGDGRLFNGEVPPWPEARRAIEVGTQLAKGHSAQFYFSSPNEPNDTSPTWIEANA